MPIFNINKLREGISSIIHEGRICEKINPFMFYKADEIILRSSLHAAQKYAILMFPRRKSSLNMLSHWYFQLSSALNQFPGFCGILGHYFFCRRLFTDYSGKEAMERNVLE